MEQALKERQRQEVQASRDAISGVDTQRLDVELKALRKLALRPAAMAAAVEEIENERAALLAAASGKRDANSDRATKLTAHMPEIVAAYRNQIQQGLRVLADERLVHEAREGNQTAVAKWADCPTPYPDQKCCNWPGSPGGLGAACVGVAGWQRKTRQVDHGM